MNSTGCSVSSTGSTRRWRCSTGRSRFLFLNGGIYVLLPSLLLLAAHFLVTVTLNVSPLYLRIASVIIPLPFGMAAFAVSKIGYRGAFGLGVLTAAVSVTGMLAVVAYIDGASIVPETLREWRETVEYGLSIALAFLTGNILVTLVLFILPSTIASSGKPNAARLPDRADARTACRAGNDAAGERGGFRT